MTKAKKAILITFIVLLALAVLILGIIWGILNSGYNPVQRFISLDKLSTVMGDDIVYLSDDFLTVNNLERVGFLGNADYADSVMIIYNGFKVNPDLSARVENIDECSYYLSSKADSEGIPVNIDVYFSTKKDKKNPKIEGLLYGYFRIFRQWLLITVPVSRTRFTTIFCLSVTKTGRQDRQKIYLSKCFVTAWTPDELLTGKYGRVQHKLLRLSGKAVLLLKYVFMGGQADKFFR